MHTRYIHSNEIAVAYPSRSVFLSLSPLSFSPLSNIPPGGVVIVACITLQVPSYCTVCGKRPGSRSTCVRASGLLGSLLTTHPLRGIRKDRLDGGRLDGRGFVIITVVERRVQVAVLVAFGTWAVIGAREDDSSLKYVHGSC
jgi:hypothetical protein